MKRVSSYFKSGQRHLDNYWEPTGTFESELYEAEKISPYCWVREEECVWRKVVSKSQVKRDNYMDAVTRKNKEKNNVDE